MLNRIRQWLCSASDRQLLAAFDALPTATLETLAMCAYAVTAERALYEARTAPLLTGADAL